MNARLSLPLVILPQNRRKFNQLVGLTRRERQAFTAGELLFKRPVRLPEPGARPLGRRMLHFVEHGPDAFIAVPVTLGGALGIFGGAGLEEVGVLDAVEDFGEPWNRVF